MPALDERGFAIPMTVLLIALITVMLTSGFARVRADRQVAESQEVSQEALAIARSGLATFLDTQGSRPPDGFIDTLWVTGGYAIITADIAQNPADTLATQTWIVRSTGYVIDAGTGSTPRAQRTVAQFAEWQSGTINVRGALTAANGILYQNRGRIYLEGDDNDDCGDVTSVPGLRSAGTAGTAPPVLDIDGTPNQVIHGLSQGLLVASETDIDWVDVLNGGIVADYYGAAPTGDFSYPITIVYGDYEPTTLYGSGLLIVTGDLEPSSWVYWLGIVLVGGRIELSSSFNYFWGAVVTGLNEQITGNPQMTVLGWTGSTFYNFYSAYFTYDSCVIQDALDGLTGFAPIGNAWVDTWATY